MEFLVIGRDGTDEDALARRLAVRNEHIASTERYKKSGNVNYAAAIINEQGIMAGSVMIMEFESKAQLEEWLANEPYVTGDVWRFVEVEECKTGPSFVSTDKL